MSTEDEKQQEEPTEPGSEETQPGLESRLEEAEREKDQFKRLAQRAQADLVNYRNRVRGEQEALQARTTTRVAMKFIEVADQMEKALDPVAASGVDSQWVSGVQGIYQNLLHVLQTEGFERFDAHGEEFDPHKHDALLASPSSEHPANHVIRQLAAGYSRNGDVVRPAQVEIAKPPPDDEPGQPGE